MRTKRVVFLLLLSSCSLIMACSQDGGSGSGSASNLLTNPDGSTSSDSSAASDATRYADKASNFRFLMTDAPKANITSVFVNINQIQIIVDKDGSEGRLTLGQSIGSLDLLTLKNGVVLPIQDFNLPAGMTIKQIRFILNNQDNYIVEDNSDRCDLKTPSAQHSGLKLLLSQPITIEEGYTYSLTTDFDADKSVVLQGNGGCLLKPVIKIKSFTRKPIASDDGSATTGGDSSSSGSGSSSGSSDSSGGTGSTGSSSGTTTGDGTTTGSGQTDLGNTGAVSDPTLDPNFDPDNPATWPPDWSPSYISSTP